MMLEYLLTKAAVDPTYRVEFNDTLLKSDLFVICVLQPGQRPSGGQIDLEEGDPVHLVQLEKADGQIVIPIFTSKEAIIKYDPSGVEYLQFPAKILFEMTKGVHYILNWRSDFSKEFSAIEIDNLLHGEIPGVSVNVMKKRTRIAMAKARDYPKELTKSLSQYFLTVPRVQAAYISKFFMNKMNKPELLVGIVMKKRDDIVFKNVVQITQAYKQQVNFIMINPDRDKSMFENTEKFYTRNNNIFSRIKRFFLI